MFLRIRDLRNRRGFTLIELLIVVAIIGIIAAIIIPNLLDALQKAKQKRTVGDIRDLGTAMFSWVTDQVGAAAAGGGGTSFGLATNYGAFQHNVTEMEDILLGTDADSIRYIQEIPANDGWGNTMEYYLNTTDPLSKHVMAIRSLGQNGAGGCAPAGYDCTGGTDPYEVGPFITTKYAMDIVWAEGYFVRYPAGAQIVD